MTSSISSSMKVTVCFDQVRVVVPCGSGDLSVTNLIQLAVSRYRKAIGRTNDYWVIVHSLKSLNGGILDQDDRVIDVVDDREQIVAIFEEQDGRRQQPNGGDGTSASSVGTSSPDIFQNVKNGFPTQYSTIGDTALEQYKHIQSVAVCRSESEPTLKKHIPTDQGTRTDLTQLTKQFTKLSADEINNNDQKPLPGNGFPDDLVASDESAYHVFTRAANRKSLVTSAAMMRWLDAQERLVETSGEKDVCGRSEPVGSSDHADHDEQYPTMIEHLDDEDDDEIIPQSSISDLGSQILLQNDGSPLGIHVVPGVDRAGRNVGLVIQSVELDGRVHRDGRLRAKDRIIAINGTSLFDVDFFRAKDIFKEALKSSVTQLQVVFASITAPLPLLPSQPALPSYGATTRKPLPELPQGLDDDDDDKPTSGEPNTSTPAGKDGEKTAECEVRAPSTVSKHATVEIQPSGTGTKRPLLLPRAESYVTLTSSVPFFESKSTAIGLPPLPSPMLQRQQQQQQRLVTPARPISAQNHVMCPSTSKSKFVPIHNTRAIGRKLNIQLVKGNQGLGFSVTTRDNQAGDNCPIYIKNILPQGAAVVDGRLQPGDRLLEVDGVIMYGKNQEDVVNYLRHIQLGSVVDLIISRPDIDDDDVNDDMQITMTTPSRNLPTNYVNSLNSLSADMELMVFIISLGETGTESGLGISVKGKTTVSESGNKDLGLFVKAVVDGGAAAKDGRLRVDDQLIEVNGASLRGLTNVDAMETLRQAMQKDTLDSSSINLVVARPCSSTRLAVTRQAIPTEPASTQRPAVNSLMPPPSTTKVLSTRKRQLPEPSTVENPIPSTLTSLQTNTPAPSNVSLPSMAGIGSAFRNVSYQRATHENILNGDTVGGSPVIGRTVTQVRSAANSGFSSSRSQRGGTNEDVKPVGQESAPSNSQSEPSTSVSVSAAKTPLKQARPVATDSDNEPTPTHWDPSLASMLTISSPANVDPEKVFSRDGFGRKSVSEKRKTLLNPRLASAQNLHQTSAAGGNSTLKRVQSAESLMSQTTILSPRFGRRDIVRESLKKCSSLESLNTTDRVIPGDKYSGSIFAAANRAPHNRHFADSIEPLEEDDIVVRVSAPAPLTDKKSKDKGFFKSLFRLGKSKKEAKTPAPKQTAAVESLKDDERRENVRVRSQHGRNCEQESADQELYNDREKDRHKKTTVVATRNRSDTNSNKRLRNVTSRYEDDETGDTVTSHIHYSNDDAYCQQIEDRCCQPVPHTNGCYRDSMDYHFDRPNDRHLVYNGIDTAECCSHYQNYHELQQQYQQPPPRRHHQHQQQYHLRHESFADPLPPYTSSRHYYRAGPPPSDSIPGGGNIAPCSCAQCCSTYDHPSSSSSVYRDHYLPYYAPETEPYDRLPAGHRGSIVQQTPLLNTRRPRASSPPSTCGVVRVAAPPSRAKTPFSGATSGDERRSVMMTPLPQHRHQPSEASYRPSSTSRDRCFSAYDDPRRSAFPAAHASGSRDGVTAFGSEKLSGRRRTDVMSVSDEMTMGHVTYKSNLARM